MAKRSDEDRRIAHLLNHRIGSGGPGSNGDLDQLLEDYFVNDDDDQELENDNAGAEDDDDDSERELDMQESDVVTALHHAADDPELIFDSSSVIFDKELQKATMYT